jgi:hypothetical protein
MERSTGCYARCFPSSCSVHSTTTTVYKYVQGRPVNQARATLPYILLSFLPSLMAQRRRNAGRVHTKPHARPAFALTQLPIIVTINGVKLTRACACSSYLQGTTRVSSWRKPRRLLVRPSRMPSVSTWLWLGCTWLTNVLHLRTSAHVLRAVCVCLTVAV